MATSLLVTGLCFLWVSGSLSVYAQSNGSLPVAVSVPIVGISSTPSGTVISYAETSRTYTIANGRHLTNVFGVTADRPPLVFTSATNTIPVITQGPVPAIVDSSTGVIERGDLLVTSQSPGVFAKATEEDEFVHAIALEAMPASLQSARILVQFDPARAQSVLAQRRAQAAEEAADAEAESVLGGLLGGGEAGDADTPGPIAQFFADYTRGAVATVIAVGSLFFLMYTFRSAIINATQSVGRNPRARNAIMAVSFGNILFALIIVAVALFVAIAVLVLPV